MVFLWWVKQLGAALLSAASIELQLELTKRIYIDEAGSLEEQAIRRMLSRLAVSMKARGKGK